MVQGVREVFEIVDLDGTEPTSLEDSKIVLIGRGLNQDRFQQSLLRQLTLS